VNVADGDAVESETVEGANVPPAPPSEGVIVAEPDIVPAPRVTVKLDVAVPTIPLDGPVNE